MHSIFLDVSLSLPESIPSAFHVGLSLVIATHSYCCEGKVLSSVYGLESRCLLSAWKLMETSRGNPQNCHFVLGLVFPFLHLCL